MRQLDLVRFGCIFFKRLVAVAAVNRAGLLMNGQRLTVRIDMVNREENQIPTDFFFASG